MLAALQFLTRIPIRLRRQPRLDDVVAWFPAAGAVIGALVGAVAAGVWHISTPLVTAACAVAAGLLITGAFHEDGLGDVADAFGGGWTVERRLEIMKDSRHGTYGVAAMCASIVVRVAAIAAVPGPGAMFAVAVAAHVLARAGAVLLMATLPLATGRGLGVDYGKNTSPARAAAATVAGLAIAGVAVGWWAGPLFLAAVIAACLVGLLARRKIGGLSGDVLGAAEQVGECLVMLVGGVIALRHPLWWGS